MGFFTFRDSAKESELEKAVKGIPLSPVEFSFPVGDETKKSKVYLLPLDCSVTNEIPKRRRIRNVEELLASLPQQVAQVVGQFTIDGKIAQAHIGFSHRKYFVFRKHYMLTPLGELLPTTDCEDVMYLPLRSSDIKVTIGTKKDNVWTPMKGAPFTLLGVQGTEHKYPVMLVTEADGQLHFTGIYIEENGEISTYEHPQPDALEKVANLLQTMKKNPQSISSSKAVTCVKDMFWEDPASIVASLDEYVVGQHDAKRTISVAFSNYMTKKETNDEELSKDNLLLIGPSGVGKTYMISLLAKKANIPMVQTNLTGKSSEGYKGENLSRVFEQLRAQTSGNAPYGIVFFDEIDKIAQDNWGGGDGFGSRLQNELIGWLEEAPVQGSNDFGAKVGLSTRNILFVTAGAFQGKPSLDDIIRKRLGGTRTIGFGAQRQEDIGYSLLRVKPEDLVAYGLRHELVGRLPAVAILNPLNVDDKVKILTETKQSTLAKYTKLLQRKGYTLELDKEVAYEIATRCPPETGARALQSICTDLFKPILYEPKKYADSDKKIRISPELAKQLMILYK
ncbi:AAA family ATPase [Candidatus Woesearchaeota archaeon]|nr:AAA family ATPase [Candidatus Woesearchaeota archaeon]